MCIYWVYWIGLTVCWGQIWHKHVFVKHLFMPDLHHSVCELVMWFSLLCCSSPMVLQMWRVTMFPYIKANKWLLACLIMSIWSISSLLKACKVNLLCAIVLLCPTIKYPSQTRPTAVQNDKITFCPVRVILNQPTLLVHLAVFLKTCRLTCMHCLNKCVCVCFC